MTKNHYATIKKKQCYSFQSKNQSNIQIQKLGAAKKITPYQYYTKIDPGCSLRHKNIEGQSNKNYCRQLKAAHQSKIMHTFGTQQG